uniref:Uncharacterized protein n=1 Tax=Glossina austeni TaxID=7395 RepID=A0A1A9UV14_GLOAU
MFSYDISIPNVVVRRRSKRSPSSLVRVPYTLVFSKETCVTEHSKNHVSRKTYRLSSRDLHVPIPLLLQSSHIDVSDLNYMLMYCKHIDESTNENLNEMFLEYFIFNLTIKRAQYWGKISKSMKQILKFLQRDNHGGGVAIRYFATAPAPQPALKIVCRECFISFEREIKSNVHHPQQCPNRQSLLRFYIFGRISRELIRKRIVFGAQSTRTYDETSKSAAVADNTISTQSRENYTKFAEKTKPASSLIIIIKQEHSANYCWGSGRGGEVNPSVDKYCHAFGHDERQSSI